MEPGVVDGVAGLQALSLDPEWSRVQVRGSVTRPPPPTPAPATAPLPPSQVHSWNRHA